MALDGKINLLLTEDLSPHKITLLFLTEIYSLREIPEERTRPVLQVILSYFENETTYDEGNNICIVPTLVDLLFNLRKTILEDLSEGDEVVTRDIDIIQKLLLRSAWSINSVEDLDARMQRLRNMLIDPLIVFSEPIAKMKRISSRSFLGALGHKLLTAFQVLKFDEIFLLFESFIDYREISRDLYLSIGGVVKNTAFASEATRLNAKNQDTQLFAELNLMLSDSIGTTVPISHQSSFNNNTRLISVPKHDLQGLLDRQIHLLEAYGVETPQSLKEIMKMMTSPNSYSCLIQNINFNNLPSYYYIKYLENLHDSNYNGAFEALHQYFDYMVSSNSKYFYHFALISRASLHQFFGEDEKALDAIEEAISVARENKDNSTLTYILSWLFNFMKNKPELWRKQKFYNNNDAYQLLNFLTQKSHQVSLLLYSMSYGFETLQLMDSGAPMARYLESLMKGMYISINDLIPSFVKLTEISTTVWSRIGAPHLSEAYNEISLGKSDNENDKLSILIRSNYLKFLKGNTEIGLKNLENLKLSVKNNNALFNMIQIRSLIILIKLNLLKGRSKAAKEIIQILLSNDIKEIELKNELALVNVEVEIALGNYSKALSIIADRLKLGSSSVYFDISLNLLKCKIFNVSGCHSRALSLTMQQIQKGKKIGLYTVIAEGVVILISLLNNMCYYKDAYQLLLEAMPLIIFVNIKDLTSCAYYEFARTCMNLFRLSKGDNSLFNKVLKFLNLSIVGFKSSSNLIMLTKCFELEQELARLKKEDALLEHSRLSIEKLEIRAIEESNYGFVIKK
ncbi:uncharacterized protein PRCAT00004939001 [Priceomyces carsonii]|uniref:uncharacterized protein n=1 Tax=Priceomyces carsonii TaxID=28549 RepID=UPI002ED9D380|nr:unnamed protein product [Priceomyces carsonii]